MHLQQFPFPYLLLKLSSAGRLILETSLFLIRFDPIIGLLKVKWVSFFFSVAKERQIDLRKKGGGGIISALSVGWGVSTQGH